MAMLGGLLTAFVLVARCTATSNPPTTGAPTTTGAPPATTTGTAVNCLAAKIGMKAMSDGTLTVGSTVSHYMAGEWLQSAGIFCSYASMSMYPYFCPTCTSTTITTSTTTTATTVTAT